ncbi:hypothetical protein [Neorhodopirellula pilleata]|uniref:Double zinc ribbon n=1 Tax=Neorhodopirellula pilleata TaxID=2714738 RepID=A0A5C6AUD8_9BACT|nr:hypothetical protein [Neorhodopirellula pilleata]TWU01784.1 hypothetical protein Pla100_15200 [Neorhodopirellula pilleata]
MPIAIQCRCGKSLSVRDELAGKAVKCPGCSQPVRIPDGPSKPAAASPVAAKPGVAKPVASRPAPTPAAAPRSSMDDLFAEEGMDRQVTSICPACNAEMATGAVLCMKCGFNQQTGERMQAHLVAGVDIDAGTMALMRAEKDMARTQALQDRMIKNAGMPPWMLALVLFILGSATTIAVIAVNASRRAEAIDFSPMRMFLNLGGSAFLMVAIGAVLSMIALAFRTDRKEGLLSLTILYLFVFAFKRKEGTWKRLALAVVCGAIAGAFFAGASKY